ncbi:hypothetical protein MANES_01G045150v8 [Manihot esculenta]|uniref:Uncharacterized protein n=1 Tax=Manihot esculenta TaxID=3983 RepID=A0ACB7IB14_MANES|nr:hypothetical protein MANES_01G045150v8 [Manihot esculenta]
MHEVNAVVAENSINELIEEVVNDGGHEDDMIDEVEEANGAVLEVIKENGSHPQDLSMTNIIMPSLFILDVQVVGENVHDESFMIFLPIQEKDFKNALIPKTSIPDMNMSKIQGRIFSKGGNDTDPIG